ncbi:hypothetical protein BJ165DRAFT_899606 [Panaeolus papilionaceus]|nr:hypothetical protein BJ165DRAFT_899606 [Panaeolus papilionaceus]
MEAQILTTETAGSLSLASDNQMEPPPANQIKKRISTHNSKNHDANRSIDDMLAEPVNPFDADTDFSEPFQAATQAASKRMQEHKEKLFRNLLLRYMWADSRIDYMQKTELAMLQQKAADITRIQLEQERATRQLAGFLQTLKNSVASMAALDI